MQIYKDYFPPTIGGVEKHLNLLSTGMSELGVEIEVLVSNTHPVSIRGVLDGIKVVKAIEFGRLASAPINPNFPLLLWQMAQKADLLHFHLPNPTAVCAYRLAMLKKPFVVTYHSDIVRQAILKRFYLPIEKPFLKKARQIIATSPNYLKYSTTLQQHKDRCTVIPLGIDTGQYRKFDRQEIEAIRAALGSRIVLFVGKFRYYKGLSVLLDAMRTVSGKLVLVGDGPLKSKLIEEVRRKDLGSKIVFVDAVSDRKKLNYLHACDLFVLPSILPSEAFGVVLLEAMSCGKPVISTELGTGTSYINHHKSTGIVIPPNNSAKLSEAITTLLDNEELRSKYGQAGRRRVTGAFSMEAMLNDTLAVYKSCLNL